MILSLKISPKPKNEKCAPQQLVSFSVAISDHKTFKNIMASSVTDLDELLPNWRATKLTWVAFGNSTQEDIKAQFFPTNAVDRIRLQDIWMRHHARHPAGN